MEAYNTHYNDLTAHTDHGFWDESTSQAYPNGFVDGITTFYCAHTQSNTSVGSFPIAAPSFFLPYPPSVPLHALSNPRYSIDPHTVSGDSIPHNPQILRSSPSYYPPIQSASSFMVAPTNIPTPKPNEFPATSPISKFSCSICGRNLIGRPRAHTCLLNHTGTKPYACNGACGIEDW